ncbi:MAG: phosphatidate cytidylyltransferase [Psychromonas sp.]|uniref:phosphatidate cytidylyltransferase n=1 Tax=Psychromonas sp. TaxID=1884585 RepID=UPI0039E3F2D7
MQQRIITALILAPIAIAGIFFLPLKFFMLFSATLYLLSSKEWAGFVSKTPSSLILFLFGLVLGATLLLIPAEQIWSADKVNGYIIYGLLAAAIWWCISLLMVMSYPKSAKLWKNSKFIKSIFGLLTLVPLFWAMVVLRSINIYHDFYFGAELLMYVFFLVWAADIGAYFCGKKFGKHKLAPNVSPGKTLEGFLGGVVSAMLVAMMGLDFFVIPADKMALFLAGSLITIMVSALGDLSESIFKREAGLKDSSNLLPGHGGILDRIDSLTAAVPVFTLIYLFWLS